MTSELFGDADVIASYSRAQAIDDGVLVDVSETAREAGFRYPVALTCGAWAELVAWDDANAAVQDEAGRLWDVLWMARAAIARSSGRRRVTATLRRVENRPDATAATVAAFVAECGPGDDLEPVITLMLPGED